MVAIETKNLTKKFGEITAVDHVNFEVGEKELFGLLGPNGAGKTTTLNMLSTMILPTEGTARVNGYDIWKEPAAVRKSIGIVFQDTTLDDRLTGRENLDFHGRLYGMPRTLRETRTREVLDLVDLSERADTLVKHYSGGMMRRLEIARGLMHRPKVLFLDEPTLGLDPQTRIHIWNYIRELNEEGVTMILTTHYMDEADALCQRIGIIDQGKIIALDTPENLKSEIGGDIVSLKTAGDGGRLIDLFSSQNFVEEASLVEGELRLTVKNGERAIPIILDLTSKAGVHIESVGLRKPTLNDVFIYHTGKAIREETPSAMEHLKRWRRR